MENETIECPGCGYAISINNLQCPECGYEMDDDEREEAGNESRTDN